VAPVLRHSSALQARDEHSGFEHDQAGGELPGLGKAAAKMHLRLDLRSLLPAFVLVTQVRRSQGTENGVRPDHATMSVKRKQNKRLLGIVGWY
jgi:hypothetical protein